MVVPLRVLHETERGTMSSTIKRSDGLHEKVDEASESFRLELMTSLPTSLRQAIHNYARFTEGPPPDDPKAFLVYQTGCQAALAHIQLLTRLADWAKPGAGCTASSSALDGDQLDRLLREAEHALSGLDAED